MCTRLPLKDEPWRELDFSYAGLTTCAGNLVRKVHDNSEASFHMGGLRRKPRSWARGECAGFSQNHGKHESARALVGRGSSQTKEAGLP